MEFDVFDEPFSCTSSWILDERQLYPAVAGCYYIVALAPQAELGKLWISPGIDEVFPFGEILVLL